MGAKELNFGQRPEVIVSNNLPLRTPGDKNRAKLERIKLDGDDRLDILYQLVISKRPPYKLKKVWERAVRNNPFDIEALKISQKIFWDEIS